MAQQVHAIDPTDTAAGGDRLVIAVKALELNAGIRNMARRRGHLCTNLVPKRNSFMSCLSHLSHVQTSQRRPLSPDTPSRRPQGVWTSVLPHCVSFRSSAKQRTWWWNIAQTDNKKRRVDTDYSKTQSLRRLETVRVTSGAMLVG